MIKEVAQMLAMMNASSMYLNTRNYGNPFLQKKLNQRQKRKLNRQTGRYPKK